MTKPHHRDSILVALRTNFELEGDGHTIFSSEHYLAMGLPKEFISRLVRTHTSDGSPKGSLSLRGDGFNPIPAVTGVYNLTLLRAIAWTISANTADARKCLGRGSEARALVKAILEVVNQPDDGSMYELVREQKDI